MMIIFLGWFCLVLLSQTTLLAISNNIYRPYQAKYVAGSVTKILYAELIAIHLLVL